VKLGHCSNTIPALLFYQTKQLVGDQTSSGTETLVSIKSWRKGF